MNRKNKMLLWCVALFGAMTLVGCSDSGDSADQPGKPGSTEFALTTFHPNYGKYLEKVIFEGSGFDMNSIKVYFNQRPAAAIGVTDDGSKFYALAPRLPGDDCVISVVQGEDSLTYDEHFAYTASTTVTTVTGSGYSGLKMGPLAEAELSPYYACADKSGNLFVCSRNNGDNGGSGDHSLLRIDLNVGEVSMIHQGTIGNVPACHPETQIVTIPTETYVGSFVELNPLEMWAPRFRNFTWDPTSTPPSYGWKHCMVVNPTDGMIYTRFYFGHLVRINPQTYESEHLMTTGQWDTYGMCFRKAEPNVLYFTGWGTHRLYKLDMNLPKEQWEAVPINGGTGTAGHRDGELDEALFSNPAMIFCDGDDNMYVADYGNHCIRRVTPENQVETVLGVPGQAGWVDGTQEVAKFNGPRGVAIDDDGNVYVCDWKNARIRKLSIN